VQKAITAVQKMQILEPRIGYMSSKSDMGSQRRGMRSPLLDKSSPVQRTIKEMRILEPRIGYMSQRQGIGIPLLDKSSPVQRTIKGMRFLEPGIGYTSSKSQMGSQRQGIRGPP
jgi:hypothetical protein